MHHAFEHMQKTRRTEAAGLLRGKRAAFSEVFTMATGDGAASGFVLSHLAQGNASILWIQDRLSRLEIGRPHLAGIGKAVLLVELAQPLDVLIAAEEGLRCKVLSAVVAEISGNPTALNFTTTKRLAFMTEARGVPFWLIRQGGTPDLSAARDRWRATSLPSAPNPDDARAPGDPRWQVELFRSRDSTPGTWIARYDRAKDRVDLVAPVSDGAVAEAGGTLWQPAAR